MASSVGQRHAGIADAGAVAFGGLASSVLGDAVPYRFHHLGVKVAGDRAAERLMRDLGVEPAWVNVLESVGCRCYFCEGAGVAVEVVVPIDASSAVNAIPHSLHHVGVEVEDIEAASSVLRSRGFEFTSERPLQVVDRYLINFIRPLRLAFLLELVEDREAAWR